MGATEFEAVWATISHNPFPFISAIIIVVGAVWSFVHYIYSSRIESLNHRLDLRNDEVERLEKGLASISLPPSIRADAASMENDVLAITSKMESPLVALAVKEERGEGKIFIPDGRIYELIIKYHRETTFEAENASKPFIGNWLSVTSTVTNVRDNGKYMTVTIDIENIEDCPDDITFGIVSLYFSKDFDALKMLRKGDMVSAIGKLEKVDHSGFSLGECEFIVAQRDPG